MILRLETFIQQKLVYIKSNFQKILVRKDMQFWSNVTIGNYFIQTVCDFRMNVLP